MILHICLPYAKVFASTMQKITQKNLLRRVGVCYIDWTDEISHFSEMCWWGRLMRQVFRRTIYPIHNKNYNKPGYGRVTGADAPVV